MTATDTPAGARLDLETLADRGPTNPSPCAVCETPTRSHILLDDGQAWREFDDRALIDDVETGRTVRFAIVCHTCRTDLALPAAGQDLPHDVLDGPAPDTSSIFQAVVA